MKNLVFFLILFLLFSCVAHMSVLAQQPSIQSMINAASDGDTITITETEYHENVLVNKSVRLIANPLANIHVYALNASKHVFEVTANNVEINGFTLSGANKYAGYIDVALSASGILLHNVSDCTIVANTIYNNTNGISLYCSHSNFIYLNTVENNPLFTGIQLLWSDHNNIVKNLVSQNYYGIFLRASNGNKLDRNNVDKNGVRSAADGIDVLNSNDNVLTGNIIQHSNGCFGLELNGASNNTIKGNTISFSARYGIGVSSGIAYTLVNNSNLIYLNNFIGNTIQFYISYSINQWDNGTAGNYWSNYTGLDLNGDGIGDTHFVLDSYNSDHYPLMTDPPTTPPPRTLPQKAGGAGRNSMV